MKDLLDEIRDAQHRYELGQLIACFLGGMLCGGLVGLYLWG